MVTLGCARNEVDSEELAGRLTGQGWSLVDADSTGANAPDVIVVNTCGFVEQAKKVVPTHQHPLVPGTATAQLVAGPWAATVDKVRDLLGGR